MRALGASPWDFGHYLRNGVQGGTLLAAYAQMPHVGPVAPPRPTGRTYVVKAGDSLWRVAATFYGSGATFGRIANANRIVAPWTIHVGQVLIIP